MTGFDETEKKFFHEIESLAHAKLMKLPTSIAHRLIAKLFGLEREGRREESFQLFLEWFTDKKTAEEIINQIEKESQR